MDGGVPLPVVTEGYSGYIPADTTSMRSSYIYSSDQSPEEGSSYMQFSAYPAVQPVSQELAPAYNMPATTLAQQNNELDMRYLTAMADNHMRSGRQQYQQMYGATPTYSGMQGMYGHGYNVPQPFTTQQQGYSTGY